MHSQFRKVFFADKVFRIYDDVYNPAEDSFLFAENLNVKRGDFVLDMGTGCGILGINAAEKASKVVAVDINPNAVFCALENAKLNNTIKKMIFIQGDLFAPLRIKRVFDLIIFNAPYLPVEKTQKQAWIEYAWSGGLDGRQVIDRFIHEASKYLKNSGRLLLMQSTLCGIDETLDKFEKYGFKPNVIAERSLPFFEKIVLLEAIPTRSLFYSV